MKKLSLLDKNLKDRLFNVLLVAGIIANTIGAVSNLILYGFSVTTIVCISFAVILIIIGIASIFVYRPVIIANLYLFMLCFLEFPYLYYVYGSSSLAYFLLGIVGAAVYVTGKKGIIYVSLLMAVYITDIVLEHIWPCSFEEAEGSALWASMIVSFVISALTMIIFITMITLEYHHRNEENIKLKDEINELSKRDSLTRCFNKSYIVKYVENLIANKSDFYISVFYLKNYEKLKKQYGTGFTDVQIVTLSEIISAEAVNTGIIGRFSDDSFMVVFPGNKDDLIQKTINDIDTKLQAVQSDVFECSIVSVKKNDNDDIMKLLSKLNDSIV